MFLSKIKKHNKRCLQLCSVGSYILKEIETTGLEE